MLPSGSSRQKRRTFCAALYLRLDRQAEGLHDRAQEYRKFLPVLPKKFGITCEDRATAYGSFGFDASMQDLYPYLTKGACVYIVPEETRLDLPGLHELVTENKITMMDCTTQLGRQYVCAYPDSPTLRGMSVGGEKLVPCTPPGYPFYNTYGPTECTIMSPIS